jgi:hypothetical protein
VSDSTLEPSYSHTQRGVAAIVVVAIAITLVAVMAVPMLSGARVGSTRVWIPASLVLLLSAVIMLVFGSLHVRVDGREIEWRFGFGFPKFRVSLDEVVSARVVKNSLFHGYGIRIIPKGMLYNVSGSHAVEVVKRDHRVIRIGTDEPEALLAAIETARARPDERSLS